MNTNQGNPLYYEHNGQTVELALKDSYELIYVDYRDGLGPKQVSMVVRGDFEALEEDLSEFESESRYQGAEYVAADLLRDVDIDPDEFDFYEELIEEIETRDSSDVAGALAKQTSDVLLRVNVIDEDHGYAFEDVTPERVLADIGFPLPATEHNYRTIAQALAECSPECSVLMGYWVLGADVGQLYELPSEEEKEVAIIDPYLYLGNPFAGSGWITEDALHGVAIVKRGELRTDEDAFGYSLDNVYGGLNPSSFPCQLIALEN